jgi:hypothetical protein
MRNLNALVQAEQETLSQLLGVSMQIRNLQSQLRKLQIMYRRRHAQALVLKRRLGVDKQMTNRLNQVKIVRRAQQFAASGSAASAQSRVQSARAAVPVPLRSQ